MYKKDTKTKKNMFKKTLIAFSVVVTLFASSVISYATTVEVETDSGATFVVPKACTRLQGLDKPQCNAILETLPCEEAEVVCNKVDSPLIPEGEHPSPAETNSYRTSEANDYCLLPDKSCFNENEWDQAGGLSAFQNEQYAQSWEALEDGDLGGFICNQLEGGTGGIFDCGDNDADGDGSPDFLIPIEETTFTQFDGQLNSPDPDGYTEGITENTGIREYILNIVNFILGFLGLIAVIAVMYGGFVYLTAGGDESKTEKGKNSILYAVIGIIIILGAFALVRTVICYAPVGGDDRPSYCRATGGSVSTEGSVGLTETIGAEVTSTFENARFRLREIAEGMLQSSAQIQSIESASDFMKTIDYALRGGLNEAKSVLRTLNSSVEAFPRSEDNIEVMLEYLDRQRPLITKVENRFFAWAAKNMKAAVISPADLPSSADDDPPPTFEDAYEFMEYYSEMLQLSAVADYDENVDKYIRYAESLEGLFGSITTAKDQMTDVVEVLEDLKSNPADRDLLTDLVREINEALEVVENLEFVNVRLNASERTCSAPCVVLFDSIGSTDPSGRTILDSAHEWDLNGDGAFNSATSATCQEAASATVSCLYETPGTYVVTLVVNSGDPTQYASGMAIGIIEVTRPLSKVKLNVSSGSGVSVLALDNTVTPNIRNQKAKFTLEEARAGLTFDASGSLGSSGAPITEYSWNFGSEQLTGSNATQTYSYTQQGNYRVVLEVSENGMSERAVIFVEIGSPSSNFEITNEPEAGFQTGQTIQIDGSYSRSDNGAITSYTWSILKDGQTIEEVTNANSSFSFVPDAPGQYTARLQVIDSVGQSDLNEAQFTVESRSPSACFSYSFDDASQPGTATFRNCSTDPDPSDELAYLWEVTNGEFVDGTTETDPNPIVKFDRKGTQTVSLTVNDQYVDQNLRKEDVTEMEVEVDSILDISLEVDGGIAYQLSDDDSEAEVTFIISSENAVAFEMDYDDGDKDEKSGSDSASFTHTYTEAGVYTVTATVFDNDDEANIVRRKIFVGEADAPLPVLELSMSGKQLDLSEPVIEIPRRTSITFDGSQSLNTDGTGRRLIYLLNYGDGQISSNKQSNHIYDEIGVYEISFTVTDDTTGAYNTIPLTLEVIDSPPKVTSLSSTITSNSLETPVDISVNVDAEDIDGQITQYTWYLFDADNTSDRLETQVTNNPRTVFTFHGIGLTGEEHRVGVCVVVKDDGDNEFDSCQDGPFTYSMTVTGQNEPPRANFSVADNTVLVGEPVIFYDESTDDNEIVEIYYDVLGNGFLDDEPVTQSSISYQYDRIGTYDARVKVVDSNGAIAVSPIRTVYVESSVEEPIAKFTYDVEFLTVEFNDSSEIDSGTELEERFWDFDTSYDSDGDGVADNDKDSSSATPTHTYTEEGEYEVKLWVMDAQGNEDVVENKVKAEAEPLEARMVFNPQASQADDKVHLTGDSGEVRVNFTGSTGPITEYVIDGNVFFDSDGNGNSDDDKDQRFTNPREALLYYEKEWQPIVIKLTVFDSNGNSDFVTKQVVFDEVEEPSN